MAAHDPRRGRWIPWVFFGGFVVVFVANAIMVWASLATFTGVTVSRPYERGRGYDQVLAAAAQQDALGWAADVQLVEGQLRVAVRDRDGQPVPGRIRGVMQRPITGQEIALDFAGGAGAWIAAASLPHRGLWEARLTVWGPNDQPFDIRQRVVVP